MVDRLVEVGDDFTLPPAVKVGRVNLPSVIDVLKMEHKTAADGLVITSTAAADGYLPMLVTGRDYGAFVSTSQNTGRTLEVAKNGAGAGEVLRLVNKGTGATAVFRSGTAELSKVNANGEFEHTVAGAGVVLKSPNGTRFRLVVSDDGALDTIQL